MLIRNESQHDQPTSTPKLSDVMPPNMETCTKHNMCPPPHPTQNLVNLHSLKSKVSLYINFKRYFQKTKFPLHIQNFACTTRILRCCDLPLIITIQLLIHPRSLASYAHHCIFPSSSISNFPNNPLQLQIIVIISSIGILGFLHQHLYASEGFVHRCMHVSKYNTSNDIVTSFTTFLLCKHRRLICCDCSP